MRRGASESKMVNQARPMRGHGSGPKAIASAERPCSLAIREMSYFKWAGRSRGRQIFREQPELSLLAIRSRLPYNGEPIRRSQISSIPSVSRCDLVGLVEAVSPRAAGAANWMLSWSCWCHNPGPWGSLIPPTPIIWSMHAYEREPRVRLDMWVALEQTPFWWDKLFRFHALGVLLRPPPPPVPAPLLYFCGVCSSHWICEI